MQNFIASIRYEVGHDAYIRTIQKNCFGRDVRIINNPDGTIHRIIYFKRSINHHHFVKNTANFRVAGYKPESDMVEDVAEMYEPSV